MSSDLTDATGPGLARAAESSLRLRYQELFDFAPDCQLVTDTRGVILEANHAAAALLLWPKSFLIGKPLPLFADEGHRQRFYDSLGRLVPEAGSDAFDSRIGRRNDPREVEVRVVVIEREGAEPAVLRWLIRDISERMRVEAARDDLLRRLVTAQEDERRRVARELHDSVGQLLSALMLAVGAVRDSGPLPVVAMARLDDVQRIADEMGRTTHDLAVRLRPTALDDFGLYVALQNDLKEWSSRTGVEVHFQASGLESSRLLPEVETALYRVLQEALTNIVKHAEAHLVSVVVERQDGQAVAVVEDDGVGFDPDAVGAGRLGLVGMRERVTLIGGTLQVESGPGSGTTLRVRVPLPRFP